jgi:predicted RNase H-like HicB family nuclease
MLQIEFDTIVFQEEETYVAYSPKLDVSSCGSTVEEAKGNLKTAVRLFIEESAKIGTLDEILEEAGYASKDAHCWKAPRIVATERVYLQAQ